MGGNKSSKKKRRIIIRISRYQTDKELGELYRADQNGGISFTEWKRNFKKGLKNK